MHVHTDNSPDGHHSAMFMCEQAYAKGLRGLCFTDHVEVDYYLRDHYDKRAKQAFFEVAKARSAFRGKLIVCEGIELGQPMYDVETAEKILENPGYDIVIGSVHNLRDMQDFWYLNYDEHDINDLLEQYFDELLLLAQWAKFDTMAHITYPLRYICGEHGIPVDINKYSDKIDSILRTLVEKGKAMEINTSGLRQKLGKTMPDESFVKRFAELGGEHITIGSDAHYAEHLGAGIEEGMAIAQRCGFKYVTLFQSRQPVQIPIE